MTEVLEEKLDLVSNSNTEQENVQNVQNTATEQEEENSSQESEKGKENCPNGIASDVTNPWKKMNNNGMKIFCASIFSK